MTDDFQGRQADDPFLLALDKNTSDVANLDRRTGRIETDLGQIRESVGRIENQNRHIKKQLDDCGCGGKQPNPQQQHQPPTPALPPNASKPLVSYQSQTNAQVNLPAMGDVDFAGGDDRRARRRQNLARAGWSGGGIVVAVGVLLVLHFTGVMPMGVQHQQSFSITTNATGGAAQADALAAAEARAAAASQALARAEAIAESAAPIHEKLEELWQAGMGVRLREPEKAVIANAIDLLAEMDAELAKSRGEK